MLHVTLVSLYENLVSWMSCCHFLDWVTPEEEPGMRNIMSTQLPKAIRKSLFVRRQFLTGWKILLPLDCVTQTAPLLLNLSPNSSIAGVAAGDTFPIHIYFQTTYEYVRFYDIYKNKFFTDFLIIQFYVCCWTPDMSKEAIKVIKASLHYRKTNMQSLFFTNLRSKWSTPEMRACNYLEIWVTHQGGLITIMMISMTKDVMHDSSNTCMAVV